MNSGKSPVKTSLIVLIIGLFTSAATMAQERTVSGFVTDANDGTALPGATVLEKGTTNGTITDIDGNYQLSVSDEAELVFSYIGYQPYETSVGNQITIDVALTISLSELSEVVVIGYGTQQKKVATGSISQIKADNLDGYKVANLGSAIDGQVSGVMVTENSGQPGSGKNIFIRGIGTNGDNSPLVIVDGLTVTEYNNIAPGDIESIDILKDAASTAIYGSRAANGVVIITTKKGKKGEGSVSYEGFASVSNAWRIPDMLNSEQYIEITREKFSNAGRLPDLENRGFPSPGDQVYNTDWMDEIFNQAHVINHRLSATLNNSYLSLEYWNQDGIIGGEKSNYNRYAVRFNSTKDINDFISVGQNMYINRTENQNLGTNSAFGTVVSDAFAYDPLTPVQDENAQYGFGQSQWVQNEYINPISRIFLADNDGHADQFIGNAFLKLKPINGLTLTSDFGGIATWWDYRSFTPDYNFHPSAQNANNRVNQGYGHSQQFQFENYASYVRDFGSHTFNLVAGTTMIRGGFREAGGSTLNIPDEVKFDDNFQYINAGQDTSDLATGRANVAYALNSYYGRLIYDFQDKYLFSATLRRDGSAKFGSNKRFGVFPAFSLGWVISDEDFFPRTLISFMKLRSSWGVNGNDRIRDLAYLPTIESVFTYAFGRDHALNTGSAPTTLPNPNLKWEESVQFDVGLELKFFEDQLSTEFDYYVKRTKDLLGEERVSGTSGVTNQPIANLGEFENRGIEASISYRNSFGRLNFRTTLNYTTFKNTVIEVPGSSTFINGWNWPVRNIAITRMTEGEPVGHFVGLKTLGIFQSEADVFSYISNEGEAIQPNAKPGDLMFADMNGDGTINNDDFTSIGSPWPDHIIGLNLGADYMGFDFNILLSTQIGHDIYRTYERSDITFTNYQTFWLDRWTETNPGSETPRLVSNDPNNIRPSDFYVEDGSFLRIRNIQLGYNLPGNLLEKIKLSGVRLYVTANNLLTLTDYRGFDPEIGTNNWILDTGIDKGYYPSNKTFGGGIKITM